MGRGPYLVYSLPHVLFQQKPRLNRKEWKLQGTLCFSRPVFQSNDKASKYTSIPSSETTIEKVWAVIGGQGEGIESSISPWKTSSKKSAQRIKAPWVCFGRKDRGLCPGSYKYKRLGSGLDNPNSKPSNYVLWAGPVWFLRTTSISRGGWQVYEAQWCQAFQLFLVWGS